MSKIWIKAGFIGDTKLLLYLWILLFCYVVQLKGSGDLSPTSLKCCSNKSRSYVDTVRLARCEARCYKLHKVKEVTSSYSRPELLFPPECVDEVCRQCVSSCQEIPRTPDECYSKCKSHSCKESCKFLLDALKELPVVIERNWTITIPDTLCYNIHGPLVDGIVLHWRILSRNTSADSSLPRTPYPVVFVLQLRTKLMQSKEVWGTLGKRTQGLVPISYLEPGAEYQFRLTPVEEDGIVNGYAESRWFHIPNYTFNLDAPRDVEVWSSEVGNFSASAILSWKTIERFPSCHHDVYLLPDSPELPSVHYRITKPYQIGHFEMTGLKFSTNYTIHLISSDETHRRQGPAQSTWFQTPSCLDSYNYNFTICAPGPPKKLRVRRAVNNASGGVSVSWSPPTHTTNLNQVLGYKVTLQQKLSLLDITAKVPHRVVRSVHGNIHNMEISEVEPDVMYEVLVRAESKGGIGEPAAVEYLVHGNSTKFYIALGSSLFVVVLVMTSGGIIYLRRRRINKNRKRPLAVKEFNEYTSFQKNASFPVQFYHLLKQKRNSKKDPYEVDYNTVNIHKIIGQGAFGVVYKAEVWIGRIKETVALKTLKDRSSAEEKRSLLQEIELLKLVGYHPNVVNLRACSTHGDKVALMVEYCPFGDMHSYLRKIRSKLQENATQSVPAQYGSVPKEGFSFYLSKGNCNNPDSNSTEIPTAAQLLSLVRQVALGMEFLSSRRVVHRDLAARNILLNDATKAKITDFGLSRDMYEEGLYKKESEGKLPVRWMALESLSHDTYTTMSDVWSFGVFLWEVVTLGAIPYPGVNNLQLLNYLREGHRLDKPGNCSQQVYNIMSSCWHSNPICRPNFAKLLKEIDLILEETQDYFSFNCQI